MDPTSSSAAVAARADVVATRACALWGLGGPTLVRRGSNAVYVAGDTVIRVSPNAIGAAEQRRLGEWLVHRGYPVLSANDGQVLELDGLDVSGWPRKDTTGCPDLEMVGRAVRCLHAEEGSQITSVMRRPLATMFPSDIVVTTRRLSEPGLGGSLIPVDLRNAGRLSNALCPSSSLHWMIALSSTETCRLLISSPGEMAPG